MAAATSLPPTPATPADSPAVLATASGREVLRWLARGLRGHRAPAVAALVTSLLAGALQVLPALAFGRLVDVVVAGGERSQVLATAAVLAALVLLGGLVAGVATTLVGRCGAAVLAGLREDVVDTVLHLPGHRVEEAGRGDVLARVGDDVAVVSRGVRDALGPLLSACAVVAAATAGLFGVDWRLGLAGAAAFPAYHLALRWYLPRSQPVYARQRLAQGRRTQALVAGVEGVEAVRAHRAEDRFVAAVETSSAQVRDLSVDAFSVFARFVGRENRAEFTGFAAILVTGFLLVRDGSATVGAVSAAALVFHRLFSPVGTILHSADAAQQAVASLARLVGVLREGGGAGAAEGPPVRARRAGPAAAVQVRGVHHRYPGASSDALRGVDLDVAAGTTLALVGASGAGKTTLATVLAGATAPAAGRVAVGAVADLHALPEAERRALVVLGAQEQHVFAGELREDLALARPGAEDAELLAALDAVGADWVRRTPDGLATRVGAGAPELSAVQRAQLGMARLLLADAPVVVLDEATAEAGSHDAERLEAAAAAVCAGRTAVVVAHRLAQARAADQVVVLERGRVVERGSHDDLLAAGGRYAALWAAWEGTARR